MILLDSSKVGNSPDWCMRRETHLVSLLLYHIIYPFCFCVGMDEPSFNYSVSTVFHDVSSELLTPVCIFWLILNKSILSSWKLIAQRQLSVSILSRSLRCSICSNVHNIYCFYSIYLSSFYSRTVDHLFFQCRLASQYSLTCRIQFALLVPRLVPWPVDIRLGRTRHLVHFTRLLFQIARHDEPSEQEPRSLGDTFVSRKRILPW